MCEGVRVVNFKDFGSREALDAAFGDRWVYIGRQNSYAGMAKSSLANPFRAAAYGGGGKTLPFYRQWLWAAMQYGDEAVLKALRAIHDTSVLVCWCKPSPCHGDVVKKAAAWLKGNLPQTAFISGHRDLTRSEFSSYYEGQLEKAAATGHRFVVGDAPGADALAQIYLVNRVPPERVVVYHAGRQARNQFGGFRTQNGYSSQTAKDTAMTAVSGYDIAWVRPGKESSGTARNLARRHEWS